VVYEEGLVSNVEPQPERLRRNSMRRRCATLSLIAVCALPACSGQVDDVESASSEFALSSAPDLIAMGVLDSDTGDLATRTAPALENGVPGNRFGGIGSGIAYAGGDTFFALPDRGPNAISYDAAIDDTTSYVPRFHQLKLKLKAAPETGRTEREFSVLGSRLVGAMQSPLIQDGGTSGKFTRIVTIDIASGTTHEYAYELTNIGSPTKPKYPTVSDIVAVNDHQFLVDERDGKGLGDGSTAAFKRIYFIDLAGAPEVSAISGEANLLGKAPAKTLFLDVVAVLNAHGIDSNDIPAKLEGLAFGPDVVLGCARYHTLFLTNDNDFLPEIFDDNHPNGIRNPNQFFVFAVHPGSLPEFVPQALDVDDDGGEDCSKGG
jgi:hypothetical protein